MYLHFKHTLHSQIARLLQHVSLDNHLVNWIGCQDSIEDSSGGQSSIGGRGGKVQGMCCICGASRKDKYMWGLVDSTQAKTTTPAPMSIEICMTYYMIWSWAGHYSYMPRIVTLFGIRHSGHKLLQADWHIYIYVCQIFVAATCTFVEHIVHNQKNMLKENLE